MRHLSLPLDVCQEDSLPVDSLAPDNQEENYVFTDSLAPDNPGFGGVFNAFDKILTKAPVIEQLLTDSLVGEGKDFSDLSKRKQKRLIGKFLGDQFTEWNNIDTTYITPQLYDFALMLQTTTSFENFTLNSEGENKQTLKFAPNPSFRLGGYFGWRWIFWGYNINMNGLFGNGVLDKSYTGTATVWVGDNDADGDFGGAIKNSKGNFDFTKIGAGTQRLGGPVTIGGDFRVNGGTLLLEGTISAKSVAVANGALIVNLPSGSGSDAVKVVSTTTAMDISHFTKGANVQTLELRENGTELWGTPKVSGFCVKIAMN